MRIDTQEPIPLLLFGTYLESELVGNEDRLGFRFSFEFDATTFASSSFLVPLGALFLGWALLAEGITFQSAFGTVLVLFGVCVVNMGGVRIH